MIAPWMLYCVAVGVLLSACAAALDGALRPLGRPTRGTWMAALVLTLALPAAVRMFGALPPVAPRHPAAPTLPAAPAPKTAADAPVTRSLPRITPPALPRVIDVQRLETPLATLWIGSSAAGALVLAALTGALARRRRGWAAAEVDGVPVLVSADVGPAVVGLLRGRIVLPRWVVDGDAESRALVLEHEREHVRAGDPRLLACALLLAVLTPWNPAVWWQLRRLRLAVEADCDARVLRRRGDVRAYGAVLLEVGRRASRSRLAAAAAFAEPVSTLERRIRIMTAPRARRPLLRAAAL
ncbi:MAG TPA: M56 family metallopeptidase, partial [Longimicrobium sp.]|nr:M56 family metallopeptidase [Longimicrobium sp.]